MGELNFKYGDLQELQWFIGIIAGQPSQGGGGRTGGGGSAPWAWDQLYMDPGHYMDRVIEGGFSGTLGIARGPYPPGYHVPNGQKGGGYPAQGAQSNGSDPIRLQPPPSGTGRLKYFVEFTACVLNRNDADAALSYGLGVIWPSEFNKPMWPYLGVGHQLEVLDGTLHDETIRANSAKVIHCNRLDILDNDFISDQPVPNWPNWEMALSSNGNQMFPAVGISVRNAGIPLIITDVFVISFVC